MIMAIQIPTKYKILGLLLPLASNSRLASAIAAKKHPIKKGEPKLNTNPNMTLAIIMTK